MPTYDYRCKACGHEFELYQSMTESTKRKCPECAQLKLERLIGAGGGILFKGGGFYETDYRSKSYTDAAQADKSGSGSEKKSDTSGKDVKSDASGKSGSKDKADKKSKGDKSPRGD